MLPTQNNHYFEYLVSICPLSIIYYRFGSEMQKSDTRVNYVGSLLLNKGQLKVEETKYVRPGLNIISISYHPKWMLQKPDLTFKVV